MIFNNFLYYERVDDTQLMDEALMREMVNNRLSFGDPAQPDYYSLYTDDEKKEIADQVIKIDAQLRPLLEKQAADGGIVAQAIYDAFSDRVILKTKTGESIFGMKIVSAPAERSPREGAPRKIVFFDNLPAPQTPAGREALEEALVDAMRIALFSDRRYIAKEEALSEQNVVSVRQRSLSDLRDELKRNFFIAGTQIVTVDSAGVVRMFPAERDLAERLLRAPSQPRLYFDNFEFQRTVWDVKDMLGRLRQQQTLDDFSAELDGGRKLEERAVKCSCLPIIRLLRMFGCGLAYSIFLPIYSSRRGASA